MQVSNVSEAVRELAKQGLITVVRLGRKNIYYVRAMGSATKMPPSDPEPFFEYLRELGVRLQLSADGKFIYGAESFKIEGIERAIFSDYMNGLTPSKASAMLAAVTVSASKSQ
jgi:hypothetical protein